MIDTTIVLVLEPSAQDKPPVPSLIDSLFPALSSSVEISSLVFSLVSIWLSAKVNVELKTGAIIHIVTVILAKLDFWTTLSSSQ